MLYQDHVFNGEAVELDGNQFLSCRFIDCTIRYKGGAYAIETPGTRALSSSPSPDLRRTPQPS